HDRLHARPKAPGWDPHRHGSAGGRPAGGAAQAVHLILRHYRLDAGQLGHLMAGWAGGVSPPRGLAVCARVGLDRDDRGDLFEGHQRPALALMARLASPLPSTRDTAGAVLPGLGGITRRWTRGVARVLLEAFQQLLDGGFERGKTCFERADILLDGTGRLLPQLRGEGA